MFLPVFWIPKNPDASSGLEITINSLVAICDEALHIHILAIQALDYTKGTRLPIRFCIHKTPYACDGKNEHSNIGVQCMIEVTSKHLQGSNFVGK